MIDGKKWSTVRVGFSLGNVEHEIYSNILSALLSALLSIAGGIAVALVLTRIITKPVGTFIKSMRTISEGDLSQKIEVSSPDEFGQMADSFNRMAHSLSESEVKLKETFAELAQKQKLAALGELSARVAHEIKNPLGIIRGSAQIIVDEKTPLAIKEEVGRFIVEETDKLNHTVMDILNYAQPRMRELVPVDLNALIRDNHTLWGKAAAEKGTISLQLRLAGGLPEVRADQDLVLRALLNIVMNACEAAEDGGEIDIRTFSKDDSWIAVSVSDNGPGIDGPDIDKIFEPFFTTKKNGTGLGLSIVRNIVESHNGRVTAENREEGGTSVTIYFPLVNADPSR
jgi:signal transduction histidine kinase